MYTEFLHLCEHHNILYLFSFSNKNIHYISYIVQNIHLKNTYHFLRDFLNLTILIVLINVIIIWISIRKQ